MDSSSGRFFAASSREGRADCVVVEQPQRDAEAKREKQGTGTKQQESSGGDRQICIDVRKCPMTLAVEVPAVTPKATAASTAEMDDDTECLFGPDAARWAASAPPGACRITHSLTPAEDIDSLEDGLFSDDTDTYMKSAKGVTASVGERLGIAADPKSRPFVKRVAARLAKDLERFRRILMRLDESNEECQLATADMLYRLVAERLLAFVAPSDIIRMVQTILTILSVKVASKGVDVEIPCEVKSLIAFHHIGTLPTDKPLSPVDVVSVARLYLMRCGLLVALELAPAAAIELRNSFLHTHKATIRQLLDIIVESAQPGVAFEAVALLRVLYKPSPPIAVAVELCSIFVESLKVPADEQPAGVEGFFTVLFNAAQLWSTREEEWSVVRAALSAHVYSHFGGLVDLIAHRPASTYTRWAASLTLGTFIHASLTLCITRRKADGHALIEIEQHGVDKVLSPAPMPMEPLRRLVLDAVAREGLVTAASLD
ncbi:unnamed protein product [Vitrella brassicaformis CCMP3155]|uniref:Uncharacterized protein n=2 Tax=Vitrella brassicaformis TaxID=1169539 RepID=A0A0G4GIK5_VITBC|nr:unnamed protein product [Vitrella brassicaformis CCMP3155]|eukprot:CEM29664.1 unnamed protein product [Vitrella brassicaformis CCMP3155]